jgi:peptidoglycan/LPS O-acetylase OafA/YrhL
LIEQRGAATVPLGLAFTIVSAAISYRLIEKPFLKAKARLARVRNAPV